MRYAVFMFSQYECPGGWDELRGLYPTLKKALVTSPTTLNNSELNEGQIVDLWEAKELFIWDSGSPIKSPGWEKVVNDDNK
jgi:hypothetical protein